MHRPSCTRGNPRGRPSAHSCGKGEKMTRGPTNPAQTGVQPVRGRNSLRRSRPEPPNVKLQVQMPFLELFPKPARDDEPAGDQATTEVTPPPPMPGGLKPMPPPRIISTIKVRTSR